jgi:tRNA 2-thiouridine synthesizing protein E
VENTGEQAKTDFINKSVGGFMSIIQINGIEVAVDEDGFLEDPAAWSESLAKAIADSEDVPELTENHWKVINYLRDYYTQFGIAPMIRKLCKETGFPLKDIYEMFPSGPAKGACKIAGLPKPTGCV